MSKRIASRDTSTGMDLDKDTTMLISDDYEMTKSQKVVSSKVNDTSSIALLMLLYILQGIPLGLSGSIPMLLQQRNVSYKDQATFSLAFWPFSVKILWAPIVDSCYWHWMGRRKSWLIPSQYLIGIFMLTLSVTVNGMLGEEGGEPQILLLTFVFFMLTFLAATQDIAVDGWALTILSKRNLGWASTCNSVGQTAGYFLGFVVFLALESKDFCSNYLGQTDSLVTLSGFFFFWGIIFIATTTFVWIFKEERPQEGATQDDPDLDMMGSYKNLFSMIKMPPIQKMVAVLLTAKVAFAASDALTVLKLTESGVPKDRLAMLSIPLTPIQIILPFVISRYTAGPRPMNIFMKAYIPRLFFNFIFAGLIFMTPLFKVSDGVYSPYFYLIVVLFYMAHQVTLNMMFVSQMAFYAQISDPKVGGTYMTLLNTFTNLGGNWPAWMALRFVGELTWKSCVGAPLGGSCNSVMETETCTNSGGFCSTSIDGYYVETILLFVFGFLWYRWGKRTIVHLQSLSTNSWLVKNN